MDWSNKNDLFCHPKKTEYATFETFKTAMQLLLSLVKFRVCRRKSYPIYSQTSFN